MIVVSDTSPLNYFVLLGVEHVLPKLFNDIRIPPAVLAELKHPKAPEKVYQWASQPPTWLRVQTPNSMIANLDLDRGETEAISLSLELKSCGLLIDDLKGRKIAMKHGLPVIGTLTVLEIAAEQGLVSLPEQIDQLRHTNFRVSQSILDEALQRDAIRRQVEA